MSISIKLTGSNFEISKAMYKALAQDLNKNLKKNTNKAKAKIKALIPNWISEQPEIASLLDENNPESLNSQFTFLDGESNRAVSAILIAMSEAVEIEFEKIKDNLDGGIFFYIQPDNFANILSLSEAVLKRKSQPLPWLDWLLTQGSRTIVFDYEYSSDTSGKPGGGSVSLGKIRRVPPEFSGSPDNNFITRALSNREKELIPILQEAIYG